jgi:negative regulator of sigma E activity
MKTATLFLCSVFSFTAFAQNAPNAEQIIGGAKMVAALQQADLEGSMTHGRDKVPVALFLRNKDIQFQYYEKEAWQKFHLRMNDDVCELYEMINNKQTKFPVNRLATPIAGTDLSYEDLAMRFFYWKKPVLEGAERVGVHNCWKIRLNNPGQGGAYQVMYVWVHQKYGAFMKIEGFNRQGQILKRFEVTDVMNIGKNADGVEIYTLKQMNVSTLNPANDRVVSQTKLIFNQPAMKAPKGPR